MMRKRKHIAFAAVAAVLIGGAVAIATFGVSVWEKLRGNSPVTFYGRVVDANGNGVGGVAITFEGLYSDKLVVPAAFVDREKQWQKTVYSDNNGNFKLAGVHAYSVRGASGSYAGKAIGLVASNVPPSADPMYGVSLNDRSSRRLLPDAPEKRIDYRIVELR